MNTINFKLSKKLKEQSILFDVDTIYYFYKWKLEYSNNHKNYTFEERENLYKTLTLEEAIEFLPIKIDNYYLVLWKNDNWYWGNYLLKDEDNLYILDKSLLINICNKATLLEVIEQLLEYLLDNNLLPK